MNVRKWAARRALGGRWRPAVRRGAPLLRRAAAALAGAGIVALGAGIGVWLADVTPREAKRTPIVSVSLPLVAPPQPEPEPTDAPADDLAPRAEPQPELLGAPAEAPAPPAWRRFAVAAPAASEPAPMIALVLDDMGVALDRSWQAIGLRGPLTLAYLPYAQDLAEQTAAARRAGHELLLHLPMEPDDAGEDPGPNALLTGLDEGELGRRLEWNLGRFGAYVGVNNHMGSRLTRDAAAMEFVLAEIKARGLLFLDSRTTPDSIGLRLARRAGVPAIRRDVFIDNAADAEAIAAQLAALEALARERGFAVGIGHPRPATLKALEAWLPRLAERGFALVPISAIVARVSRLGDDGNESTQTGYD